jgi:hypothetical protein
LLLGVMSSSCAVCTELLGRDLSVLSCGHVFHSPCINDWLKQKPNCPLCKATAQKITQLLLNPAELLYNFIQSHLNSPENRKDTALHNKIQQLELKLKLKRETDALELLNLHNNALQSEINTLNSEYEEKRALLNQEIAKTEEIKLQSSESYINNYKPGVIQLQDSVKDYFLNLKRYILLFKHSEACKELAKLRQKLSNTSNSSPNSNNHNNHNNNQNGHTSNSFSYDISRDFSLYYTGSSNIDSVTSKLELQAGRQIKFFVLLSQTEFLKGKLQQNHGNHEFTNQLTKVKQELAQLTQQNEAIEAQIAQILTNQRSQQQKKHNLLEFLYYFRQNNSKSGQNITEIMKRRREQARKLKFRTENSENESENSQEKAQLAQFSLERQEKIAKKLINGPNYSVVGPEQLHEAKKRPKLGSKPANFRGLRERNAEEGLEEEDSDLEGQEIIDLEGDFSGEELEEEGSEHWRESDEEFIAPEAESYEGSPEISENDENCGEVNVLDDLSGEEEDSEEAQGFVDNRREEEIERGASEQDSSAVEAEFQQFPAKERRALSKPRKRSEIKGKNGNRRKISPNNSKTQSIAQLLQRSGSNSAEISRSQRCTVNLGEFSAGNSALEEILTALESSAEGESSGGEEEYTVQSCITVVSTERRAGSAVRSPQKQDLAQRIDGPEQRLVAKAPQLQISNSSKGSKRSRGDLSEFFSPSQQSKQPPHSSQGNQLNSLDAASKKSISAAFFKQERKLVNNKETSSDDSGKKKKELEMICID